MQRRVESTISIARISIGDICIDYSVRLVPLMMVVFDFRSYLFELLLIELKVAQHWTLFLKLTHHIRICSRGCGSEHLPDMICNQ